MTPTDSSVETVLVIDDDATFCGMLARGLRRLGYRACTACDAAAAIRLAEKERPQKAVLDLRLGDETGMQLIRPLLEIEPEMRIVVLTGYASLATAVQAVKLGAADYLAKPVDTATVARVLAGEESGESAEPPAEPIPLKRLEWEHIQRVLEENDGNISATARQLKMHRRTLQRKLQKRPQKL